MMTLQEFREYIKLNDANTINFKEVEETYSDDNLKEKFTIVCKKCGSLNVQFFGEGGHDFGGYTGYSPGNNGFKCIDCGNAFTWWQ